MENSKNKSTYFGGKLWCTFFGHQFTTTKNITNHFKEYTCSHCQLQLTNDEKGHKIFLTPEHKAINETLELFFQKRHHLV